MLYDIKRLSALPELPGVYLMKNSEGVILYIGKAKNLRRRIRSYFSGADSRGQIKYLIEKIFDIDTIIVSSEREALLLENTLIKKHRPPYNICLKDDKGYARLIIDIRVPFPTIILTKEKVDVDKEIIVLGPFISAFTAKALLEATYRLFPLRHCSDEEFARRKKPCLLFDMHRCCAPCAAICDKETYHAHVEGALRFLKGLDTHAVASLYNAMTKASDALDFEYAAELLRVIRALEKTGEVQSVADIKISDADVIGTARLGDRAAITCVSVRGGDVVAVNTFIAESVAGKNIIDIFLQRHYSENQPPAQLFVAEKPNDQTIDLLGITITVPARGVKKRLLALAKSNAAEALKNNVESDQEASLLEVQSMLNLSYYPRRIECFDISHTSGDDVVAAMVTFTDGVADKSRYRKYIIRTAKASDDYGAMTEALSRRYEQAKKDGVLPDLIVIDGGRGHLHTTSAVLEALDIITVDVVAIAKEGGRHDKGITHEQAFVRGKESPIHLPEHSQALMLLQRIRDEAHRCAVTFHRKRRSKKIISSTLTHIPGIGPVKCARLLKHFGSIKRIKNATEEELKAVKGITSHDRSALLSLQSAETESHKFHT